MSTVIITDSSALRPQRISKLSFRKRFTFEEKVSIEQAAETDAVVRVLLKDQDSAEFIDLTRQDTKDGVHLLVSKSLLTAERAAEILNPAIQPGEAFQG